MAYVTQNSGSLTTSLLGMIDTARGKLRARMAYNRAYRASYSELAALTERDLTDLGIARADIAQVARDAADNAMARR